MSQYNQGNIQNYSDALNKFNRSNEFKNSKDRAFFKKYKYDNNFWNSKPKANGYDSRCRMRMLPDKSIEFEYNQEVFCTYHPNNEVTVRPFSGIYYGSMIRQVLPNGVGIDRGCRTGRVIHLYSTNKSNIWWGATSDVQVIRAKDPVRLRVRRGKWELARGQVTEPFEWPALRDPKQARKYARENNIPGFHAWLRAFRALRDEIKDLPREREHPDNEQMVAAMRAEEYKTVYDGLRRSYQYWYDDKGVWHHGLRISTAHLNHLRLGMYAEGGLIEMKSAPVLTFDEWRKVERQLYRFEAVKLC